MMRLAGLFVALAIAAGAECALAEQLTIALSTREVLISPNFTGTTVTILGVIENDAAGTTVDKSYEVGALVLGPAQTVVARRKDRVLGIWANRAAETIVAAPALYALDTSAQLEAIATPATLARLGLGFDTIAFTYQGRATSDDQAAAEFRAAYIRLKEKAGLFSQRTSVEFIGDAIFRSTVRLPANIPVGRYTALVYLFSDGALIAHADDAVTVSKTGFEQAITRFATGQSLLYGLFCAGLAVFVGWLGGVIFRRD